LDRILLHAIDSSEAEHREFCHTQQNQIRAAHARNYAERNAKTKYDVDCKNQRTESEPRSGRRHKPVAPAESGAPFPRAHILDKQIARSQSREWGENTSQCHDRGECTIIARPQNAGDQYKVNCLNEQPQPLARRQVAGVSRKRTVLKSLEYAHSLSAEVESCTSHSNPQAASASRSSDGIHLSAGLIDCSRISPKPGRVRSSTPPRAALGSWRVQEVWPRTLSSVPCIPARIRLTSSTCRGSLKTASPPIAANQENAPKDRCPSTLRFCSSTASSPTIDPCRGSTRESAAASLHPRFAIPLPTRVR